MSPSRKTVLITGCSPGGIGHALALEFHSRGCHVVATARQLDALSELGQLGISVVALDVTDASSIAICREQVKELVDGKLDILVNNAGRSHTLPALDADLDDVRLTYETNVFGPMAMCSAFIRLLIRARGLIINISSVSTVVPYLFGGIYSSTKGAINVYSRALRMELQPFNVRVMVAMTGTVRSNFTRQGDRSLPCDSLYLPVNDRYLDRVNFSQETQTMSTDVYARGVVSEALKGEGWLGGLIGRTPDWYWAGGLSTSTWWCTWLPSWLMEAGVARFFRVSEMSKRLESVEMNAD